MSEIRFRVNMPVHGLSISGQVREREFREMSPAAAAVEASCSDFNVHFAEMKPGELPTFIVSSRGSRLPDLRDLQVIKARLELGYIAAAAFVPESVS